MEASKCKDRVTQPPFPPSSPSTPGVSRTTSPPSCSNTRRGSGRGSGERSSPTSRSAAMWADASECVQPSSAITLSSLSSSRSNSASTVEPGTRGGCTGCCTASLSQGLPMPSQREASRAHSYGEARFSGQKGYVRQATGRASYTEQRPSLASKGHRPLPGMARRRRPPTATPGSGSVNRWWKLAAEGSPSSSAMAVTSASARGPVAGGTRRAQQRPQAVQPKRTPSAHHIAL
mmetsp:Transcript_1689/g.5258  ORF Transcript_1689/g.5258 Transcript_1689/m.5258 type:complete len:233 (+) Transcript_1689:831-1529(+)